jgi:uncharacterized membrane protein YdjX (TVP38/TMEM64 family)
MAVGRLVALGAVIVLGLVAAAILLPHSPAELRELLHAAGVVAPLIAIVAWALLTPALFPGTVLAAAGGLAFGVAGGAALAVGGAVTGGMVAFALARTIARGTVERLLPGRFAGVSALLERRGFAAVLAARLTPGVPSTALHYAAGLSPVGARPFAAAIAVGALLRTAPYALLGQGLASGSAATMLLAGGSIALGAVAAAALVWRLRAAAAT